MTGKMLERTIVMLLMVMGLSPTPSNFAQQQSGEPTIVFIQDHARPIVVAFTAGDLTRVARDAGYVLEKMRVNGVMCCGEKKRITQYLWVCCNGNRIRTSNQTLVSALERVWRV